MDNSPKEGRMILFRVRWIKVKIILFSLFFFERINLKTIELLFVIYYN